MFSDVWIAIFASIDICALNLSAEYSRVVNELVTFLWRNSVFQVKAYSWHSGMY